MAETTGHHSLETTCSGAAGPDPAAAQAGESAWAAYLKFDTEVMVNAFDGEGLVSPSSAEGSLRGISRALVWWASVCGTVEAGSLTSGVRQRTTWSRSPTASHVRRRRAMVLSVT